MSRKLADQLSSDLYDVFLNVDEHAETIQYAAAGGQLTSIVALVEQKESAAEANGYEFQDELIIVTVGNDPANAKGGVLQPYCDQVQPQNSDMILRGSDATADKYVITGNIIDEIEGGWRIEFRRVKSRAIGGDWHQRNDRNRQSRT